jgi:hypothetical protein
MTRKTVERLRGIFSGMLESAEAALPESSPVAAEEHLLESVPQESPSSEA